MAVRRRCRGGDTPYTSLRRRAQYNAMSHPPPPTLLGAKRRDADPVFRPENLLREARRQRRLPEGAVPAICALDPDGDAVRWLRAQGRARRVPSWACYHTELDAFEQDGRDDRDRRLARSAPRSRCWWRSSFSSPAAGCCSA